MRRAGSVSWPNSLPDGRFSDTKSGTHELGTPIAFQWREVVWVCVSGVITAKVSDLVYQRIAILPDSQEWARRRYGFSFFCPSLSGTFQVGPT